MFQEILETVSKDISTVRNIIKTNENLRELLSQTKFIDELAFLASLKENIPNSREWRIYEHCAAVTRLYAIYESFVEDLVRDWLAILPTIYPNYLDLDERIRNTHQIGVGQLLINLHKNRYQHLSIEEVVSGIFYGTQVGNKYELLPDSFLIHEQNLRKEILDKLFADAGILNAWHWLEKHRAIKNFVQENRGNQNTAEGEINELISYRNDSAHGTPQDILSANSLLELCDFLNALCEALTELMTYHVIERQKFTGQVKNFGKMTEWFKKPQAGVAIIKEITLSIGDSIFLVGESYCQIVKIESIELNNKPLSSIDVDSNEIEIGLKFNINAKKGLYLYKISLI